MVALRNLRLLSNGLLIKNSSLLNVRHCSESNKERYEKFREENIPAQVRHTLHGAWPKTKEERIKAAERYGMHPDEYKPFPDIAAGYGDYPDLPWIGTEAKDPYYPWDIPGMRKNYGETVHAHAELIGEDRFAAGVRTFDNHYYCALIFIATYILGFFVTHLTPVTNPPVMEKQYPGKKPYYTFEAAK